MGCNCKATNYVRTAKKYYGYDPETKDSVSGKEKAKMFFQALLMWLLMLVGFPFVVLYIIFAKVFVKKKGIKLFGTIRLRI